jgi:hypothetical protein
VKKTGLRLFEILLVIMGPFALSSIDTMSNDPGVGWHLKTGEWIFKNQAVPFFDPFLAASAPRPWVCDQWLSDLIMYLVHNRYSWAGLTAIPITLFLITFFCILYPFLLKRTSSALAAIIVSSMAFTIALVHLIVRPVVFSFLFFSLVLFKLLNIWISGKERGQFTLSWKDTVFFCIIFLLWANLHPSFVLGLALLVMFFCSLIGDTLLSLSEVSRQTFIKFGTLILIVLAVTGLNPNGYGLHLSILELGSSEFFMQLNIEWLQNDFSSIRAILSQLLLFFIFLGFLINPKRFKNWGCFEVGITLLGLHFLFQAIRLLPYLSLLLAYPACTGLCVIFEKVEELVGRYFKRVLVILKDFRSKEVCGRSFGVPVSILMGVFFTISPETFVDAKKLELVECPKDGILAALNETPLGTTKKVLASPNFGGCITFFGEERLKAIIDDRNTMLGEEIYRRIMAALKDSQEMEKMIHQEEADFLLIEKKSLAYKGIKKRYQLLHKDKKTALFKVSPK